MGLVNFSEYIKAKNFVYRGKNPTSVSFVSFQFFKSTTFGIGGSGFVNRGRVCDFMP